MVAFWWRSARISVILRLNGENALEINFLAVSGPGNGFAGQVRLSQNNCVYIWSELPIQFEVIHIMQRSHGSTSSYFWSSPNVEMRKKSLIIIVQVLLNALVVKGPCKPCCI